MAIFDQRGQKVNNQYNAAHDINFNQGMKKEEFLDELNRLKSAIEQLANSPTEIPQENIAEASEAVDRSTTEAKKETPNKKILEANLGKAQLLLNDFAAAVNVVAALGKAIAIIGALFG